MKKCSYCGAEYPDDATVCAIDQTPFTTEAPVTFADVVRWTPKSPLGRASASGLAVLLICTGIFFTIGRIECGMVAKDLADDNIQQFYQPAYGFVHPAITYTLFCLGALSFTFFVCYNRCLEEKHAIITTFITICAVALLTIGQMSVSRLGDIAMIVPMINLGTATGSSVGYYIGAALQVLAGTWLLGWFRWRKPLAMRNTRR